jgi:hypothetical protein
MYEDVSAFNNVGNDKAKKSNVITAKRPLMWKISTLAGQWLENGWKRMK